MNAAKAALAVLSFFAVSTLLSLWSLYAYRHASLVLVLSVAALFLARKKLGFEGLRASPAALAMCLLVAFLAAYPYLLVTPGVDASADPAAHISSLALGSGVPQTYGIFSQMEYRYQVGFPLLAKMFIDLLYFVPDGAIVWFLGVLFSFASALLLYLVAKEIFAGDERLGLLAIALFIGSKIVFQNMYWGQYTFLMASAFFLAAFLTFLRGSKLALLFFPAIAMAHPGVFFYALLFFAAWAAWFRQPGRVFQLMASALLAAPAFIISYLPYLRNSGAEQASPLSVELAAGALAVFPPWVGLLVFCLAVASISVMLFRRSFQGLRGFFASVFLVSSALSVVLSATGRILGSRVVELAMISGIFLALFLLHELLSARPRLFMHFLAAVTLVSLVLFFSSGLLSELREGTKITPEETSFANAFRVFDPKYESTLFLLSSGGKVAEVSGKVPYDVMSLWYLSYDPRIAADDMFYPEAMRRHALSQAAIAAKCVQCVMGEDFRYLVAEAGVNAPDSLAEVFRHGNYVVYARKESAS